MLKEEELLDQVNKLLVDTSASMDGCDEKNTESYLLLCKVVHDLARLACEKHNSKGEMVFKKMKCRGVKNLGHFYIYQETTKD